MRPQQTSKWSGRGRRRQVISIDYPQIAFAMSLGVNGVHPSAFRVSSASPRQADMVQHD